MNIIALIAKKGYSKSEKEGRYGLISYIIRRFQHWPTVHSIKNPDHHPEEEH